MTHQGFLVTGPCRESPIGAARSQGPVEDPSPQPASQSEAPHGTPHNPAGSVPLFSF